MVEYGYVRVSTAKQRVDRQLSAMHKQGIEKKNIYIDKITGVNFDRPKYLKLIKKLKKDDVIFIKSIDRLGRDYDKIIEQWRFLVKEKEVNMIVIDFPLLIHEKR